MQNYNFDQPRSIHILGNKFYGRHKNRGNMFEALIRVAFPRDIGIWVEAAHSVGKEGKQIIKQLFLITTVELLSQGLLGK